MNSQWFSWYTFIRWSFNKENVRCQVNSQCRKLLSFSKGRIIERKTCCGAEFVFCRNLMKSASHMMDRASFFPSFFLQLCKFTFVKIFVLFLKYTKVCLVFFDCNFLNFWGTSVFCLLHVLRTNHGTFSENLSSHSKTCHPMCTLKKRSLQARWMAQSHIPHLVFAQNANISAKSLCSADEQSRVVKRLFFCFVSFEKIAKPRPSLLQNRAIQLLSGPTRIWNWAPRTK